MVEEGAGDADPYHPTTRTLFNPTTNRGDTDQVWTFRLPNPRLTRRRDHLDKNKKQKRSQTIDEIERKIMQTTPPFLDVRPRLIWSNLVGKMRTLVEDIQFGQGAAAQHLPVEKVQTMIRETQTVPGGRGIVGPVYILANDKGMSLDTPMRVQCVTVPELDFSSDKKTRLQFLDRVTNKPNERAITAMRETWFRVLSLFQSQNVQYPVLRPLGIASHCLFAEGVLEAYASALVDVLSDNEATFQFQVVFLALPRRVPNQFAIYQRAFVGRNPKTKVALSKLHGMVDLAITLAKDGKPTGLLNSTSVQAMSNGDLGRHWRTGLAVDTEELLAVQTTVLLQGSQFNPKLLDRQVRKRHRGGDTSAAM